MGKYKQDYFDEFEICESCGKPVDPGEIVDCSSVGSNFLGNRICIPCNIVAENKEEELIMDEYRSFYDALIADADNDQY